MHAPSDEIANAMEQHDMTVDKMREMLREARPEKLLTSGNAESVSVIHTMCLQYYNGDGDQEPADLSTFHDALDQARWIGVTSWGIRLNLRRHDAHYDDVRGLVCREWNDPRPDDEPRISTMLRNITTYSSCPHKDWLMEEAQRIDDRNRNRFDVLGTLWGSERIVRGVGPVRSFGPFNRPKQGNAYFSQGHYAWDPVKRQLVTDKLDRVGWVPAGSVETCTKETAKAAIRVERAIVFVPTVIVALMVCYIFMSLIGNTITTVAATVIAGLVVYLAQTRGRASRVSLRY